MLAPRSIAIQGLGYGARHISLQGLVPFEAGEGALGGGRIGSGLDRREPGFIPSPYQPRRRPSRPAEPADVLTGEELAALLAGAPVMTAEGIIAQARRAGVDEDRLLRSLGTTRGHLEALFEARGPEIVANPALLPALLAMAAAAERAINNRLRTALLLAAALLMWD